MGKAHLQPKLSDGFERATRKAEGFHSDFRGPFSVPTPEGYLYLLTLIDDYTRRVFGFLTKSQTEWMDIWPKFVARVEAELGNTAFRGYSPTTGPCTSIMVVVAISPSMLRSAV